MSLNYIIVHLKVVVCYLKLQQYFSHCYSYDSAIFFYRTHPAIEVAKVVDDDHDPLTSIGGSTKSAMHLALEEGKHDRTLVILELSKSK